MLDAKLCLGIQSQGTLEPLQASTELPSRWGPCRDAGRECWLADISDPRLQCRLGFVTLVAACLQALLARLEVKLRLQQQNVANIGPLLQRLFPKTARSGDTDGQLDDQDACIACWAAWR